MNKIKKFYFDMFSSHYQVLKRRGVYEPDFQVIVSLSLTLTLNLITCVFFAIYFFSIQLMNLSKTCFIIIFLIIKGIVFLFLYYWYYHYNEDNGRKNIVNKVPKYPNFVYFSYKILSGIALALSAYLASFV